MVCDTWIFGERGLVDMLVLTYFFVSILSFYFSFITLTLLVRLFPVEALRGVSPYFDLQVWRWFE